MDIQRLVTALMLYSQALLRFLKLLGVRAKLIMIVLHFIMKLIALLLYLISVVNHLPQNQVHQILKSKVGIAHVQINAVGSLASDYGSVDSMNVTLADWAAGDIILILEVSFDLQFNISCAFIELLIILNLPFILLIKSV